MFKILTVFYLYFLLLILNPTFGTDNYFGINLDSFMLRTNYFLKTVAYLSEVEELLLGT